jgi:hypothetical protein
MSDSKTTKTDNEKAEKAEAKALKDRKADETPGASDPVPTGMVGRFPEGINPADIVGTDINNPSVFGLNIATPNLDFQEKKTDEPVVVHQFVDPFLRQPNATAGPPVNQDPLTDVTPLEAAKLDAGTPVATSVVWPGDIAHETEAPLVVTNDNPATNGNPSGGDSTALDQPGGAANAEEGSTSDDADASGRPELTEAQQKRKAEAEEKLPQNWEELDAPAMRELAKAHNVEVGPSDKRAGMIAKIKDEFHLD